MKMPTKAESKAERKGKVPTACPTPGSAVGVATSPLLTKVIWPLNFGQAPNLALTLGAVILEWHGRRG